MRQDSWYPKGLSDEYRRVQNLIETDPARAWTALLEFLEVNPEGFEASSLTDLFVGMHLEEFIQRIEEEVETNPPLADLIASTSDFGGAGPAMDRLVALWEKLNQEADPGPPFADAIVVAAGLSTRMGGWDKLGQPLGGRPLLQWSVEAMAAAKSVARVIVVTRPDRVKKMARMPWLSGATVVAGGDRRSDSVRAGVAAATADIVLVHDGARPLVSPALADAVASAAAEHGAAVPVVPLVDSLKRDAGATLGPSVERDGLVRTQTPQGARRDLLLEAFAAAKGEAFSDEAALLESRGIAIATVPGSAINFKVTTFDDLVMATGLMPRRETTLAIGQDAHGFGPDDGLWLGGIEIPGAPRLYGHSDGDVVLHAVATAILSGSGNGDLGRLFPPSDSRTTGIASSELLREAIAQAAKSGWVVESAQVSLVGARPKLGGQKLDEMARRVAELLAVSRDSVAISASTGNLNGAEGAGRVISATALIGLHRR